MPFIDKQKRIIIPRWREYNRLSLPEDVAPLKANLTQTQSDENLKNNIAEKVFDWEAKPSFSTALEIVNSSYALGTTEEAKGAAKFILDTRNNLSPQLKKIVNEVLEIPEEESPKRITQEEHFGKFFKYIGKKVNGIRGRLAEYPLNPILWLELGRLHSILGNTEKAEKSIVVSLTLSNNGNRFILRSASRFYHHIQDYEKALYTIRKAKGLANDPWLISSEISYSLELGRYSKSIETGIGILRGNNFSNFEISDLAGTIGTLEFFAGSIKSAKKLFDKSLLQPNENSLAQAEWISHQIQNINVNPWLQQIPNAFEARAHEYLHESKIQSAVMESCNWMIDQPFSRRAAMLSSYISCGLLRDYKNAIQICEFGLRTNPNEFLLVNNLIYSLANDGQIEKAANLLARLESLIRERPQRIIYLATQGLIRYRQKRFPEGKALYKQAIDLAKELDLIEHQTHAYINYVKEEYWCKNVDKETALRILRRFKRTKASIMFEEELKAIVNEIEGT